MLHGNQNLIKKSYTRQSDTIFIQGKFKYYLTLYVLKGREEPSEQVKTNCVESPEGILICTNNKIKNDIEHQNKTGSF